MFSKLGIWIVTWRKLERKIFWTFSTPTRPDQWYGGWLHNCNTKCFSQGRSNLKLICNDCQRAANGGLFSPQCHLSPLCCRFDFPQTMRIVHFVPTQCWFSGQHLFTCAAQTKVMTGRVTVDHCWCKTLTPFQPAPMIPPFWIQVSANNVTNEVIFFSFQYNYRPKTHISNAFDHLLRQEPFDLKRALSIKRKPFYMTTGYKKGRLNSSHGKKKVDSIGGCSHNTSAKIGSS